MRMTRIAENAAKNVAAAGFPCVLVLACVNTNSELFSKEAIAQLGERYNGIVEVVSSIRLAPPNKINLYTKIADNI